MGLLGGKRGIVFGVANKRSIAWAIAQALSGAGMRLAFTYQGERLKENVEELAATLPGSLVYPCDVSSDGEVAAVFASVGRDLERLDTLVHSVGFARREDLEGTFVTTEREGFRVAHDVSAYSLVGLTRAALPLLERSDGPSVLAMTYLGSDGVISRLAPELVLTETGLASGRVVTIDGGRIASIEPLERLRPGDVALAGKALLPGTVNAHCHTFQSLLRGLGDDLDFMGWRDRVLYPFSQRLSRRAIALGASFAFAEMLLHGATTCVDFFYLQDDGNENAEAVIEAARAVGIRLVLARAMYDWEGAPARYRETVADATRRTRELMTAHRRAETTLIQPAPHSPHGASPAMIRAGWELAEDEDTRFHIHVAEGQCEGERTRREHG